ncbi:hypothetical protein Anas_10611 [Armadillidium nasatum]|uniref:Uncharacterized protein n=1 Tax=Armadillidium nasatum TaxID=96803 RepID=A0A5N5T6N8_9CRUS|nr:hypothetical protein Anas_10611 [Armadillidium nasatum]
MGLTINFWRRDSAYSEFGIAAMKLSNLACASHFTICIESIENLMLISNDEDHVDVGSIYKNNSKLCKCLKKIIIFQEIVNT